MAQVAEEGIGSLFKKQNKHHRPLAEVENPVVTRVTGSCELCRGEPSAPCPSDPVAVRPGLPGGPCPPVAHREDRTSPSAQVTSDQRAPGCFGCGAEKADRCQFCAVPQL